MESSENPTPSDAAQRRLLDQLNETQRRVVEVRFFGPDAPRTLEESALILSLPAEEVAAVEESAMAILGQLMPPDKEEQRKRP